MIVLINNASGDEELKQGRLKKDIKGFSHLFLCEHEKVGCLLHVL